jgi:hypothetical protein
MSPAPVETIPAINTATGTLLPGSNDQGFPKFFVQGTRTLNFKGARSYGKSFSHLRVTPKDTVCKDMALDPSPTTSSVTTKPSYVLAL